MTDNGAPVRLTSRQQRERLQDEFRLTYVDEASARRLARTNLRLPKQHYQSSTEKRRSFAPPLLEMCKLMAEVGLGVHLEDLVNVTGYSVSHWLRLFGNQRTVLKMILGETRFNVFEYQLQAALRDREHILRDQYGDDVPETFDKVWEEMMRQYRRDQEIAEEMNDGEV